MITRGTNITGDIPYMIMLFHMEGNLKLTVPRNHPWRFPIFHEIGHPAIGESLFEEPAHMVMGSWYSWMLIPQTMVNSQVT